MMLHVSDVMDKWIRWLADFMFNSHHVMEMAVEHINQTRRIITFLYRLF